jgi:hypothetical protein
VAPSIAVALIEGESMKRRKRMGFPKVRALRAPAAEAQTNRAGSENTISRLMERFGGIGGIMGRERMPARH